MTVAKHDSNRVVAYRLQRGDLDISLAADEAPFARVVALNLGARDAMLATVKHFAAYGGAEGGRDYNSVELSERALWETYLPPYEAAVRAGVATVMSSFNDIGGVPAHASDWLLGDVLRNRWAFKGLVVSDWAGIEEMIAHGVAANKGDAGLLAIRAGEARPPVRADEQHRQEDECEDGRLSLLLISSVHSTRSVVVLEIRPDLTTRPSKLIEYG